MTGIIRTLLPVPTTPGSPVGQKGELDSCPLLVHVASVNHVCNTNDDKTGRRREDCRVPFLGPRPGPARRREGASLSPVINSVDFGENRPRTECLIKIQHRVSAHLSNTRTRARRV